MTHSVTGSSGKTGAGRRLALWAGFWTGLVALGLALGLWQWERAEDKRALLARHAAAPRLTAPVATPPDGAQLTLRGEYLAEATLFLDNRTHRGRLGVAVLTPLRGEDGRLWLVERGFLATGPSRQPPVTTTPAGTVTLQGRWQADGEGAPVFGPNREGRRLQRIELDAWAELGDFAQAGWLHLERGPGHLDAWWEPNVLPPARHLGYALQWWGLSLTALVVMILGGRRLWRDRHPSSRQEGAS